MSGRWRWVLLCAYIFFIYSTLGLVRGWSEILCEHGLIQNITGLSVVLFLFLSIGWGWQRASRRQRLGRVGISILLVTGALLVNSRGTYSSRRVWPDWPDAGLGPCRHQSLAGMVASGGGVGLDGRAG